MRAAAEGCPPACSRSATRTTAASSTTTDPGTGGARRGATGTLSRAFAALADPTRRAILERLAGGEATVGELAAPFAMSQQAISQHLKVLEQAGLISRTRAAQARPCALAVENLDAAAEWIGRHRRIWAERYDRLDAHLDRLRGSGHA